ncbi:MAG: hypothetical protein HQK49_02450 [Oligoflexia bacterium]|nr:hypothetical protein [Oligoflexia bacterium]
MLLSIEDHLQFRVWVFPARYTENIKKNINKNINKSVNKSGISFGEFEQFWQLFYVDELSLAELGERYRYVLNKFNFGPKGLWFKWLYEMHICFIFVRKQISIEQLSIELSIPPKDLIFILRDFFLRHYPEQENFFNHTFSLSTFLTDNLKTTFNDIDQQINSMGKISPVGIEDDDKDQNLIELFSPKEWKNILRKLHKDLYKSRSTGVKASSILRRENLWHQFVIFIELMIFVLVAFAAIMLLRWGLKTYEDYGEKKLALFAPDFLWPEQSMIYEIPYQKNRIANISDVEDITKIREKKFLPNNFDDDERFETESDLAASSTDDINSLPENFHNQTSEESYKNSMLKRREFRDDQSGKNKVYRLVMRTSDVEKSSQRIEKLISRYSAEKISVNKSMVSASVDALRAGGEYYNLYVSKEILKEFVANISSSEESVLYVTKSSKEGPVDKSKVFIWLKEM